MLNTPARESLAHSATIYVPPGPRLGSKVIEAINAGVNEYLAKPVRPVDLFHRITALIERPRRFIKASTYFGPDRRRRQDPRFSGPWRRSTDEEAAAG